MNTVKKIRLDSSESIQQSKTIKTTPANKKMNVSHAVFYNNQKFHYNSCLYLDTSWGYDI